MILILSAWLIAGQIAEGAVIDGDTFILNGERIRLWGIDAQDRGFPQYAAATRALAKLIEGQRVRCQWSDRDHYHRIQGKCVLETSGEDLAELMVRANLAVPWCSYAGTYYDEAAKAAGQMLCGEAVHGDDDYGFE